MKTNTTDIFDLLSHHQELMDEWDYEKNEKDSIFIEKPLPRNAVVHWKCSLGHQWTDTISHRLTRKSKCPYCQNKRILKGYNDLITVCPSLAAEWDYSKNSLYPFEVTRSSGKKVWWICPNGHPSYQAQVCSRHNGSGCPICNTNFQTSFPEQAILFYLKKVFPDVKSKYKDIFSNSMELDIFIPSLNIAIEYDGIVWHNSQTASEREKKKYLICKKNEIYLYRIAEVNKEEIYADKCIIVPKFDINKPEPLNSVIIVLLREIAPNNHLKIDISKDRFEILKYRIIKYEDSLAFLFPDVSSEWYSELNGNITPDKILPGSSLIAWWKCKTCGNIWKSSVVNRTKGHGCNICAKEKRKDTYHSTRLNTRELLTNCDCVKDWDYEKNCELPAHYTKGSGEKVWWKCRKCGYEWKTAICDRTRDYKNGCPACSHRILVVGMNDLATAYPALTSEWHPTLNGDLTPTNIAFGSHKKVWWKCNKCGFDYEAQIYNRVMGRGCPCCAHRIVVPGINDLTVTHPEIALDWHPTLNGNLKPTDVTHGKKDLIWWKCHVCGYEWLDSLNHRSRGRGCRICKKAK